MSYAVSTLRPAPPRVDPNTIWSDTVKRGSMVRDVRGLGTLVPEDIRWIAAQTEAHVDMWALRPPASVKPDSIIMELSDPTVQKDAVDAEYQFKGAQADYENLQVQVASDLMSQKANETSVRSDYEQANLQHDIDVQLAQAGLTSWLVEQQSRIKAEQLAIRLELETERTRLAKDSANAKLVAQQARVEQMRALFNLKKGQLDALHVRAGVDGVLQLLSVEVGQHVTPGMNLARVADPRKLRAEIKIAETQAKDVVPGQKATVDTRNGIVKGHVSRVDPAVINGTVTVDVALDGPLPPGARPDLSVDGTIILENLANVLYVARPVHGQSDSTVGLFRIDPDGAEAQRVNVKLGRSSVNQIEILDGLKVGDKVILSDMAAVDQYDRVKLK